MKNKIQFRTPLQDVQVKYHCLGEENVNSKITAGLFGGINHYMMAQNPGVNTKGSVIDGLKLLQLDDVLLTQCKCICL